MSQEKNIKEVQNKVNIDEYTKNEDKRKEEKNPLSLQIQNIDNISNDSKTKLEKKFAFWFCISKEVLKNELQNKLEDISKYESKVKKIAEFDTAEDFWTIFQHLKKPDKCQQGIEFQLFKVPIKPIMEDEYNENGGKLAFNLRKQYTTIIWEEIILAIIGGNLPKEINEEINGVVFSSKKEFNTIEIWFKTYNNKKNKELELYIRDLIQIPKEVPLELQQFFPQKRYYNNKKDNINYEKYGSYQNNYGYANIYKRNRGHYHKKKEN